MANAAALRRLGAELRRLREEAGLHQATVAEKLGRSHTTLLNWERGKTQVAKADLLLLLTELRAPVEAREALEELRLEARKQGRRNPAAAGLSGWFRSVVSFEQDAELVTIFEPTAIPGLLQTEAYMRAVFEALPQLRVTASVDAGIAARQARQRRLMELSPLRFHAVIGEPALHIRVGGPAVMAEQLRALLRSATRDNVTLQVLPNHSGTPAVAVQNFAVLHFPDPDDPPLAYFDSPVGGDLIHDPSDVAALSTAFADLAGAALPPTNSAELVAAILDDLTDREVPDERTDGGSVA